MLQLQRACQPLAENIQVSDSAFSFSVAARRGRVRALIFSGVLGIGPMRLALTSLGFCMQPVLTRSRTHIPHDSVDLNQ